MTERPDSVDYRSVTLKALVARAYSLHPEEISGPDWIGTEKYDVIAKIPASLAKSDIPAMLQRLLVERFNLSFHYVKRDVSMFSLVVDKDGPKLREAEARSSRPSRIRPGYISIQSCEMPLLAQLLTRMLAVPVEDRTNLTGKFDVTLEWSPLDASTAPDSPPSLFTAVQEQLGLKLKSGKEPLDILTIDRVDRTPTPN